MAANPLAMKLLVFAAFCLTMFATSRVHAEEDPEQAEIYAGINNLTDREPPIVGNSAGSNGNTYPGLCDALGRYLFLGVGMGF